MVSRRREWAFMPERAVYMAVVEAMGQWAFPW
jgi:hypothetical protein